MANKWSKLKNDLSVERVEAIDNQVAIELAEMPLNKIRNARHLTQKQVAQELSINQAAVSKIENQTDMHIKTLGRFIEAMGGKLELVATFPEGKVKISELARV